MKLQSLLTVSLLSSLPLVANQRPLVALNFNETTEEGGFANKGRLAGEASLEGVSLPKPAVTSGVTAGGNDKAIELQGEQVNTTAKYTKYSRVALKVPEDLEEMSTWSLSMWFTAAENTKWQQALFSWGATPRDAVKTGLLVALNTDAKGQPQFRVDVEDQSFYSAPFEKTYGDAWLFVTMVFKEGELIIYTANRDKDVKPLYKPKLFEAKAFRNIPGTLLVGSADSPFSNLGNHKGKIDNVLFYDRAISLEEIQKLHALGRREMLP